MHACIAAAYRGGLHMALSGLLIVLNFAVLTRAGALAVFPLYLCTLLLHRGGCPCPRATGTGTSARTCTCTRTSRCTGP